MMTIILTVMLNGQDDEDDVDEHDEHCWDVKEPTHCSELWSVFLSHSCHECERRTDHNTECYCFLRHVLAVPNYLKGGILICISKTSHLGLAKRFSCGNALVPLQNLPTVNQTISSVI